MNGRRLLLVAYAFPPLANAQGIRWLMLVRQLCARGCQVDVLTIRVPEYFDDLLDEIPAGVQVHRTWAGPLEGFSRTAKAAVRSDDDWVAARQRGGAHGLVRGLYRGVRRLADGMLIPDLCSEWLPFAVARGLALLRERRFDAIVSASEPGVGHLAAWALKRRSGLPWLADFGDPWVNQNTPGWRQPADAAVERALAGAMDGATVTASPLAQVLEARHPRLRPVRVVRQGFDRDIVERVAPAPRPPGDALHVVYTGTLYPGLREPTPVFEALRVARSRGLDVRVTLAGRLQESMIDLTARLGVADAVSFAGVVPYKHALALQKSADVLLYFDNVGTPLQVPGKLYEYVGARRPILVVRQGEPEHSPGAACVRAGGCGRDVEAEPAAIADALAAFDAERRAGRERVPDADFAEAHTFSRSADELGLALEEAIARAGDPVPKRSKVP